MVPLQGGPGSGDKANGDTCVCVCVCVCVCGSRTSRGLEKGDKANGDVCVLGPGEVLRGAREGERLLPSKEDARGEELKNHSELLKGSLRPEGWMAAVLRVDPGA